MNESENVPTQENINEIDNKENCTKIINQIKLDSNLKKYQPCIYFLLTDRFLIFFKIKTLLK